MKNDFLSEMLGVPIKKENILNFVQVPYNISIAYDSGIIACTINNEIGYIFRVEDMEVVENIERNLDEKNWKSLPKSNNEIFAVIEVNSTPIFINKEELYEYEEQNIFILKKKEQKLFTKKINIMKLFELALYIMK